MKMIKAIMSHLTDTHTVIPQVKRILQDIDTEFPIVENEFNDAVKELRRTLGTERASVLDELIDAYDRRIVSNLMFLVWNGIHHNLSCFYNPVNKLLLKADFEDMHQEHMLCSLPATINAQNLIDCAYQNIPSKLYHLTEPITSYYAYLETMVYKLGYYFGFLLADELLYWVVPGYRHDSKTTCAYSMEISKYLNVDIV